MNILLVSQCKKRALTETRRIIDQFAERCGERTWQTAMTEDGLQTLYKLLRKTARKNTAVACYWTHGKNLTDLLWIVGDRSQFNQQGRVPTNRTKRNILKSGNESSWHYATTIQLITTIAGLLHDLGKATIGFQSKLRATEKVAGDPYRHEWISLQLFLLMIQDCTTDQAVFERLANFSQYQQQYPNWYQKLNKTEKTDLMQWPLLTQWIAWLIVSHHRMPFLMPISSKDLKEKQKDDFDISGLTIRSFYKTLKAVEKWVKNSFSQHPSPNQFWQLKSDITLSQAWLKKLSRYANKALIHPPLMQLTNIDAFLLHMSRLSLMVADHNYSSLSLSNEDADKNDNILIANTNYLKKAKQCLDDHLIGVANLSARFARLLPKMVDELPAINQHKPFTKRTTIDRFQWQNHAYDIAKHYQSLSDEQGFFGVNMASTGCGKTLANGRIMYALANPKRGVRFTIALGLRVLTLQTGKALREKLQLSDEHLAILVGGRATQTLFELENEEKLQKSNLEKQNISKDNLEQEGSESIESLVDDYVDVAESGIADSELGTIIENSKARQLINAPIVTCTIDHIIQASECIRGGKYIAPTLRLLTSDLILDEPDDFDQNDLPALARLVYLAGLYGSKVLLSSATLTPDLIAGLFAAYQAGRKIWNQNHQRNNDSIVCGWFDEYQQSITQISDNAAFSQQHQLFVSERINELAKGEVRRQGHILELLDYQHKKPENEKLNYYLLANQLLRQSYDFHLNHHQLDEKTQKQISIGLIRFAHTEDVIALTKQIYQQTDLAVDTQFHIVVYHARQLLLLRNQLEQKLDRILNRTDPKAIFKQPEIIEAIKDSDKKNHIFIIIGTPVTEVGRDHDYDWAIIEPSSMRSIIQLVGRVWRHRPNKVAKSPNVAILGSNIESIKQGVNYGVGTACFCKPGFEQKPFLLTTHQTNKLIPQQQLANIDATPRITNLTQDELTLAQLEHKVMAHLFALNARNSNYVTSYWQPDLAHHHCSHLQLISPFRMQNHKEDEFICQLDEDGDYSFSYAEIAWQTPNEYCNDTQNKMIKNDNSWQFFDSQIQPWLTNTVQQALEKLTYHFPNKNLYRLANEFCNITLNFDNSWYFHPYFGFYQNKG
ncbi:MULTISPECIES: type I-F CRISPR-associated helicase Cas3f [unclassified Gilliamella]|uniref:type I-F CRISPR-associated helicase Cas3f n=1 Tax=unclassified Gilliamella TaxID=2685620 RepID=UPI002269A1F0|nr:MULTISPECIES: type I-F CRISPR-associated helicase Cas3f [unclassified Gilliamella]MCX8642262.1 type I-F CRISPR-associated helicase Cas3 [Gilliamella sp. B3835]MCX8707660.1 type I-F CRISPR-associated helicase Cas3 [Gilliamella sp. B3783]MCX8710013.1 type I-F CRISPR-associated helicase Cas3 [Gilliamella sp. B3780]MCX8713481.1 type I-F CRISPR-associated helicase Cas3 [Gilliamella sp. B3781]MCX8716643.1 type I-F CRISPR-associated helicase Cas3 [Gilliamella sp. B3784]